MPFAKVTEIDTEVKKMMTMGIIEPSKYPFCSPRLLIKKASLTVNTSKCRAACTQVDFVGHKVGAGQLTTQIDQLKRL